MGWLDKAFSLPTAGNVSNAGSSAMSFVTAAAQDKLSEASRAVAAGFGAASLGFSKIGANLPTFKEVARDVALGVGNPLASSMSEVISAQLGQLNASVEATPSASQVKAAAGVQNIKTDHLVRLTETARPDNVVIFDVLPEIVEARTVQYDPVAPSQFLGAFQKYKGTDPVQWTINATFTAKNSDQATRNLTFLNLLRGWTMPFYGTNTGMQYPGTLGAPPPILMFEGLRKYIIGPVPVVITSLNWNWPRDVDWLPTATSGENIKMFTTDDGRPVPFPAIMQVAIQCVEALSIEEFNKFSLADYREGDMRYAFNSIISE